VDAGLEAKKKRR